MRLLALDYAIRELGVREVGNNRGERVGEYQAEGEVPSGSAWCASVLNWCAKQAAEELGVHSPLEDVPLQSYVQSYVNHGIKNDWQIDPEEVKPGDLFCIYFPSLARYAHIGFVRQISIRSGTFQTVEGNSNTTGSREGVEVASNTRRIDNKIMFLRWTKVVTPRR